MNAGLSGTIKYNKQVQNSHITKRLDSYSYMFWGHCFLQLYLKQHSKRLDFIMATDDLHLDLHNQAGFPGRTDL